MNHEPTSGPETEPLRTWLPAVLTGVAVKVIREGLNVNTEWLGSYLSVSGRQVRNWEAGRYVVPTEVWQELDALQRVTDQAVADHITRATDQNPAVPVLTTYSTDADYHASGEPEPFQHVRMPASWHRGVIYRAAAHVPGVQIVEARPSDPIAAADMPYIGTHRLRAVLKGLEPLTATEHAMLVDFIRGIVLDNSWNEMPWQYLLDELHDTDTLPESIRQSLTDRVTRWDDAEALAVLHAAHRAPELIPVENTATEGERRGN